MVLSPCVEDSSYSLFKIKKKNTLVQTKLAFCTEYSASGSIITTPTNQKYNNGNDATKKVWKFFFNILLSLEYVVFPDCLYVCFN